MRICSLKIERFRGIKTLDWTIANDFVCLIGAGDSTKSTILDAVELALSSRWDYSFDDSDFYDGDTTEPLVVTATLTQLPPSLITDSKFGREIRGWSPANGLRDEPQEGDEPALSIRLKVDSSLEPSWTVINDRNPDGRPISARERQALGVLRLGASIDRQFTWNDGTVLARITGKVEELPRILAEAARAARASVTTTPVKSLVDAAVRAQELGKSVGVAPRKEFGPGLDVRRASVGPAGMSLHDGNIPLRRAGLGTRRLLAVALQREAVKQGGITLVDELENGLEPHRLRSLIEVLKPAATNGGDSSGQVLVTTHSPIAVVTLDAEALKIVRTHEGRTTIVDLDPELQDLVRAAPEALLARRILVCEGKTEVGLCMELDRWWARAEEYEPFAFQGVVPVLGDGASAAKRAVSLADLGYDVAFLGDSDAPITPDAEAMRAKGIAVHLWDDNCCIEQRLAKDLPWPGVVEMIALAIQERGEQSVLDTIRARLGAHPLPTGVPGAWPESEPLRAAIGAAANSAKWFKNISLGKALGRIACPHLATVPASDLGQKLAAIRAWVARDA